jgi:hypothetical protein
LASDHHDAVLALALGSLSFGQCFETLISRATASAVPPLDLDDPLVLAALGVVSLARSLRRWLEEAAAPTRPPQPSASSTPLAAPRELLR